MIPPSRLPNTAKVYSSSVTSTKSDPMKIKTTHLCRLDLLDKAKHTLQNGGTVFVGENHSHRDGRELCIDLIKEGVVSCLCLEFDKALLDSSSDINEAIEIVSYAENSPLGHKPPISASHLMEEANNKKTHITFIDNQSLTPPRKRQEFIAKNVKDAHDSYATDRKGLLVLIGSSHLKNLGEGRTWKALQTLDRNYDKQKEKDIGLLENGTALVSLY